MPELLEVETVKRALLPALTHRKIERLEVFTPALREPLTPLLDARLEGREILDVRRRGRYLIVELEHCGALLMHLGMTGVIRVEPPEVPKRKHEHLFLHLSDGMVFRFECTRRFSVIKYAALDAPGGTPHELDDFGPEPLTEAFSADYLFGQSRKCGGSVKAFLMNNRIVVGVGNIYAAESLFLAGLHPLLPASQLTRKQCGELVDAVRKILTMAIESGGTTISDYRHVDGTQGQFYRELRMYGRSGERCRVCGTVIESCRIAGRSSFYCPRCQKAPGGSRAAAAGRPDKSRAKRKKI